MFLIDLIRKVGSIIVKIFSGRTGRVISRLQPLIAPIVEILTSSTLTGEKKAEKVLRTVVDLAIASGVEVADHAINFAIELELAELLGKNIEKILDQGLERAREIVAEVGKLAIAADVDKKREAAEQLRMQFTHDMKNWLTDKQTLHLLIEAAVAMTKN